VCPVGGGGLVSGVATAVKTLSPGTRVVAVEPQTSRSLTAGLAAGAPVTVVPASIADGLNAPFVGANCLAVCRALVDDVVLVTEAEIEVGMRFLYERAKLACEPAGAATTGALLAGKIALDSASRVVAVVSGGNVVANLASAILDSR
jgi:threonine dehydratase